MNSERVLSATNLPRSRLALYDVATTRRLERQSPDADQLMRRAGEAVARLALALAPHGQDFWIACGPGNNGGDGLWAAHFLQRLGKNALVSQLATTAKANPDVASARTAAQEAGARFMEEVPQRFDACVDALFGIGSLRAFGPEHTRWIEHMNQSGKPVLSVDVPTGLNADTGTASAVHVLATHTLSLLTLKPGLFTAQGRDACGEIWFNGLSVTPGISASAWLAGPPLQKARLHSSHKGSYGDVCIVGGASGMAGAALLAARSALHSGAGRVYLSLLQEAQAGWAPEQPELMLRNFDALDLVNSTVVAGCGGGKAIATCLGQVLSSAARLVLDADALNAIALSQELQDLLRQRPQGSTVLTPHPLEAARLLGCNTPQIQSDRLQAARELANHFGCTVALKGSGTVLAEQDGSCSINPTGNALLATAGTGDVLAGMVGAALAQGMPAAQAARDMVYLHGLAAHGRQRLCAADLL